MLSYADPVTLASVDSSYTAQSINAEVLDEMFNEENTQKILRNSVEKSNSSKLLEKTMSDFRNTYMLETAHGRE